ncbi:MAG TPA: hypothetical protein VH251_10090 [Verrucomicrobiae bacterium]|jgi:hypothetical protein|nr:hypothetical protein [Verrucomicrobiae bacterium]
MLAVSDLAQLWHAAAANPRLALTALGLGLFVAFCFFKPIFGDWEGFWECVKFWFTPDIICLFRGQWQEQDWSELKLFLWFALSAGTMVLAYYQLPARFPALFHAN